MRSSVVSPARERASHHAPERQRALPRRLGTSSAPIPAKVIGRDHPVICARRHAEIVFADIVCQRLRADAHCVAGLIRGCGRRNEQGAICQVRIAVGTARISSGPPGSSSRRPAFLWDQSRTTCPKFHSMSSCRLSRARCSIQRWCGRQKPSPNLPRSMGRRSSGQSEFGWQRVGCHLPHGFRLQDAHIVEATSLSNIWRSARNLPLSKRAAATDSACGRPGDVGLIRAARRFNEAASLSDGIEASVDHMQRPKHAARQKFIERLAGRNLDNTRKNVDAPAVFPDFARLMGERQAREAMNELG